MANCCNRPRMNIISSQGKTNEAAKNWLTINKKQMKTVTLWMLDITPVFFNNHEKPDKIYQMQCA